MQVVIDIVLPLFMRLAVHGLILLTATTAVVEVGRGSRERLGLVRRPGIRHREPRRGAAIQEGDCANSAANAGLTNFLDCFGLRPQ
jgi:hypothetical protein